MVLMHDVAFKAWLCGALEFSKVLTAHTQAPEVPVWGWWANDNADGVRGGGHQTMFFVYAMPAWMGTGHQQSCSAMPMLT